MENKNPKLGLILFFLILILAVFYRFHHLSEYFYFIGDAGRDAQEAYKIIFDQKFTLIGPRASVAGFFMGPLYFYAITIPLIFFKMDPIGLAYFSSFLGVIAVVLLYLLTKKMFGIKSALVTSLLYAVNHVAVNYSRTAWNPSPVPIFTLILIYCLYQYINQKETKWLISSYMILGLGGQLHYTFWFFGLPLILISLFIEKINLKFFLSHLLGIIAFGLSNITLIIFDLRHQFIASRAFFSFLFGEKVGVSQTNLFNSLANNFNQLFRLIVLDQFNYILGIIFLIFILLVIFQNLREPLSKKFLSIVLIASLIPLSFFQETIQLYYYNYLLPLPFLLFGYWSKSFFKGLKFLGLLLITIIIIINNHNPNINQPKPYRSLAQIREISQSIVNNTPPSVPYNIASFTYEPWYSAEEYRYFTYYFQNRAKNADDYRNLDILYIISDKTMDNPLAIKSQETNDFGGTKLVKSWQAGGSIIYQIEK